MKKTIGKIEALALRPLSSLRPFVKETNPAVPRAIVNSFPKSGTHLLSKLISDLGFVELPLLVLSKGYCDFSKEGPWDKWQPIVENKVEKFGNAAFIQRSVLDVLPRFRAGQFAPSHLDYSPKLEKLLRAKNFKQLLIVRDLRDCVFSYIHHHLSLSCSFHRPDWYYYLSALNNTEEQLITVIEGRHMFLESYRRQIEKISKWLDHPEVLVVCYEHLIGANGGGESGAQLNEVKRILDFLGLETDAPRVEKAASSLWGGGSRTFRSGKMGYWKDAFTPRVQKIFDRELGDIQEKVQGFIQKQTLIAISLLCPLIPDLMDSLELFG